MTFVKAADETSAQPVPRRRVKKPKKGLSPDQAVRLVVTRDGTFVPADTASRKLCKDRGMSVGSEFIGYLYEPRDPKQWRRAHQLGTYLVENLDEFHGLTSHRALKKLQEDGNIAMDTEVIDLGSLGKVTRSVPQSLAFGFMDETRFTEVYRSMCEYIAKKGWLGEIEPDAVEQMEKLMLREPQA